MKALRRSTRQFKKNTPSYACKKTYKCKASNASRRTYMPKPKQRQLSEMEKITVRLAFTFL